jgi:RNA polymerase sigma-70 factor (ECF subfamily)
MLALLATPAIDVAQVFDAHGRYVFRALRHLGVPEHQVEDAVQEVFVVVHRRSSEWDGRSQVTSWLHAIALRVAADHRKRSRRRRETAVGEVPEVVSATTPEDEVLRHEARSRVLSALEELDDAQREVTVLFEIEQLPMAEVAALLGVPLQTAYSRLYAGRRLLAAHLSKELR